MTDNDNKPDGKAKPKPVPLRFDMTDGAPDDETRNPIVRDFQDYTAALAQSEILGGDAADVFHVGTAFHVSAGE